MGTIQKILRFGLGFLGIGLLHPAWAQLPFVQGEVLVKYKQGVLRERVSMNALYDSVGASRVHRFHGAVGSFEKLVLDDRQGVAEVVSRLQNEDSVEWAQPNYLLHLLPVFPAAERQVREPQIETLPFAPWASELAGLSPWDDSGSEAEISRRKPKKDPSFDRPRIHPLPLHEPEVVVDPDLAQAYGLSKIGAPQVWPFARGSRSIIVADIDTGVDYNHPDLVFNIWRNPHPVKNDLVGFDFVHQDGLPYDDNEHGTHVAGIIGAVGSNGLGVSGVSQRVSIMVLKFLSGSGSGTTSDAIEAIDYAVSHGAKVLNNSWGSSGGSGKDNQLLIEAFHRARDRGVLFIAAAGNEGNDNDGEEADYPAAFHLENEIAVAASDEKDELAEFSNYGKKTTHLAAPGVNIYSTVPGGGYRALSGSSMAAPMVSGAAALLWSAHPDWTDQQIKQALLDSVDAIPSLKAKVSTGGRLNVANAFFRRIGH
ncbi:MAG: S8 family peptidase [Bdellovibrionia bacterium]